MTELGCFLTVWEESGLSYTVIADDEPRIDAAVSRWVDSNCSRDSILALEMTDGRLYSVKASQITSWAISTPESRRRSIELEALQDEETQEYKQEIGIWDDE